MDQAVPSARRWPWLALASLLALGMPLGILSARSPALGPLALIAVTGSIWLLGRPVMSLLVATFLLFSNTLVVASTFHGLPRLVAALVPLLLLPAAFVRLTRGDRQMPAEVVPMLGLLAVHVVSAAVARDTQATMDATLKFLTEGFLLYALVAMAIPDLATLRKVSWVLVAAGAFLGVFPLYQQLTGSFDTNLGGFGQVSELQFGTGIRTETLGELTQYRLLGAIGEQNRFSQVMLLLIPIAALRVLYGGGLWPRALALGATALTAAGFALAFSRGGAVALFLTALCGVFLRIVSWRAAGWLVGVGVLVVLALPQYRARLATVSESLAALNRSNRTVAADNAVKGRVTEMLAAGMVYLDHPLIGVGPEQFQHYSQEYGNKLDLRRLKSTRQAHNLALGLAAELGTVGLAFFVWIVGVILLRLLRARRVLIGLDPPLAKECTIWALVVIAFLASGLFLHMGYIRFFWFLLGVASAAATLGSKRSAELRSA